MSIKRKNSTIYLISKLLWHVRGIGFIKLLIPIVLIIISGLLESFTTFSTLTFLQRLTTDSIQLELTNKTNFIYSIPQDKFLLIFVFLILITSYFRIITLQSSLSLSSKVGQIFAVKVYKKILTIPYKKLISMNSSESISKVVNHVNGLVYFLNSMLLFLSAIAVAFAISLTLLTINIKFGILLSLSLLFIYFLIAIYNKKFLFLASKIVAISIEKEIKQVQESIKNIRTIKLNSYQESEVNILRDLERNLRVNQEKVGFLGNFPKYLIESLLILAFVILSNRFSNNINSKYSISLLGTYAFGAIKLLPAISQAFANWVKMKSHTVSTQKVLEILTWKSEEINTVENIIINNVNSIELKDITLQNQDGKNLIENVNMKLEKGKIIGISGESGSGKSSLLDLICGLNYASNGNIFINDTKLDYKKDPGFCYAWRMCVSIVEQRIYLNDCSIIENIFGQGITADKLTKSNKQKLLEILKICQLNNMIPRLSERVGEGGNLLSGGEAQRIALARALIKDRILLVLDECTSGLDNKLQNKIFKSLKKISKNKFIIMAAHRQEALMACDTIYKIENYKLKKLD